MTNSIELRTQARGLMERAVALESIAAHLRDQSVELDVHARELETGLRDEVLLRGVQIANKAAEIVDMGAEVHYRDLLESLTARGYVIAGFAKRDNLLACLGRDPRFMSVRPRSGIYRRVKGKEN